VRKPIVTLGQPGASTATIDRLSHAQALSFDALLVESASSTSHRASMKLGLPGRARCPKTRDLPADSLRVSAAGSAAQKLRVRFVIANHLQHRDASFPIPCACRRVSLECSKPDRNIG
jgi:hypothetical protein